MYTKERIAKNDGETHEYRGEIRWMEKGVEIEWQVEWWGGYEGAPGVCPLPAGTGPSDEFFPYDNVAEKLVTLPDEYVLYDRPADPLPAQV